MRSACKPTRLCCTGWCTHVRSGVTKVYQLLVLCGILDLHNLGKACCLHNLPPPSLVLVYHLLVTVTAKQAMRHLHKSDVAVCHPLQLMAANQRLYQAEQTSATAVANAAQLQGEVLRLSNQMDELRQDLQTQSTLAETQQVRHMDELCHHLQYSLV